MDVRVAAEIPNHGRAFELPDVPNAIVADIQVLTKGHVQIIETISLDELHRFIGVLFAEGSEQICHYQVDMFLLVSTQFPDRDARQTGLLPGQADGLSPALSARVAQKRHVALFAIEHFKDFVGALSLIPINIAGMVGGLIVTQSSVSIEDRSTKGSTLNRIAIATARHMPAGEYKFEFADSRLAKQCYRTSAKTLFTGVVLYLFHDTLGIFRAVHFKKDFANHGLLVPREVLPHSLFGDVPIVLDLGPERMVKGEHDRLPLGFGEALIQSCDEGF